MHEKDKNDIRTAHQNGDKIIAKEFRERSVRVSCGAGCIYCCYEPLYTPFKEVAYMLDALTPEQLDYVRQRTVEWLQKAQASGLLRPIRGLKDLANAIDWRKHSIACPFLRDNLCMVYERRPMGCRSFFATGPAINCDMPARENQTFLGYSDNFNASFMLPLIRACGGNKQDTNHLGIHLAHYFGLIKNSG